jgi:hypothetical protein
LAAIPGFPRERKRIFYAYYAAAADAPAADLALAAGPVSVKPLTVTLLGRGELKILGDNGEIESFTPVEPGNYALVIFAGDDGRSRHVLVQMHSL